MDQITVDAAVHPMIRDLDELRSYMTEPWASRPLAGPERYEYVPLTGEYWGNADTGVGLPGSDPARLRLYVLDEPGVDYAVLVPLTLGLLPISGLGSAVCSGTNSWLAATWLSKYNAHGRFRGSIRVNPAEPEAAVEEIERWANDPLMVQVAVPMQAYSPYGMDRYYPIWEAAASHDLPVAVHADGGCSVDFRPSAAGTVKYATEFNVLYPLNFAYHLASLVSEGVFERLPNLKFVFADGGFDMLAPLMWRLEMDWRPNRPARPRMRQRPTAYLADHIRFCWQRLDGPGDSLVDSKFVKLIDGERLLMFSSNYPHWNRADARTLRSTVPPDLGYGFMGRNAAELYNLGS